MVRSGARGPYGAPSKLPHIRHPALRLGDPDTLSVRGISRAEERGGRSASSSRKTTLHHPLRSHSMEGLHTWRNLDHWANGDRGFWERSSNEEKLEGIPMYTSAHLETQTEELQFQLLEKISSGGFYELKNLFLAQDPEGRGTVTRDALLVILSTFLGRFISKAHFQHLLGRLQLAGKPVITFDSFYDHFKMEENTNPPDWLDPMKRKQKTVLRTAHEVHLELKNMANHRYAEFVKLFPRGCVALSGLRSALCRLGFLMSDKEMKKLWQRYSPEEKDIVGMEELRRRLGARNPQELSVDRGVLQKMSESRGAPRGSGEGVGSRVTEERTLSLSIEKWLKEKFREGARAMMAEFLECDPSRTHKVSREDFLRVLERFQLHLPGQQMDHFLARCGLEESSPEVDYVAFLQLLHTQRRNARTHNILCTPGDRKGSRGAVSAASTTSILREKLLHYFHADFTSMLQLFRNADSSKMNVISQRDFRDILERRYSLKVTDEEFACLLEKIPLDDQGAIRYPDFMAKFDSGDECLSRWGDNKTVLTQCSRKPAASDKPRANGKKDQVQERSVEQLSCVIRNLVKNHYEILERAFTEMDAMNTRRLTAESLYQLMKRCGIQPEISREEVGKVWKTLIRKQDWTVDYFQFVRHFGFSTKSSCFPNAKISPPVRGDSDCLLRSLKLNSDTKIIANFLQTKVKLLLDDLLVQFKELDPENSGCITKEEFLDILQELSPNLTEHQCDTLATKFSYGSDKVSYIRFLQPYQTGKFNIRQNGNKANKPEAKAASPRKSVHQGLNAITSKLRKKLSTLDWRNLLRACQKLDTHGSGFLVLPEFQSVVKLCNIVLDEDDIYHIMSRYDTDLTGKIDYSHLFSDHNKSK